MDKIDAYIAVVVPVFRAKEHIARLVKSVTAAAEQFKRYQLILVDDASNDETFEMIKNLAEKTPNILGIRLNKNRGQQTATFIGMQFADAHCGVISTLDDDLKQNPNDITKLYSKMAEGFDAVYGVGRKNNTGSRTRQMGTRIREKTIARLSGRKGLYPVTSFKLLKRELVDRILESDARSVYISMEILKRTGNIAFVTLESSPEGVSRYTFLKFAKILADLHLNYGRFSRFFGTAKQPMIAETTEKRFKKTQDSLRF